MDERPTPESRYRRLVAAREAVRAAADALAAEEAQLLAAHPSLAEPAFTGAILPLFPETKPC
jgi:hypothetical protein